MKKLFLIIQITVVCTVGYTQSTTKATYKKVYTDSLQGRTDKITINDELVNDSTVTFNDSVLIPGTDHLIMGIPSTNSAGTIYMYSNKGAQPGALINYDGLIFQDYDANVNKAFFNNNGVSIYDYISGSFQNIANLNKNGLFLGRDGTGFDQAVSLKLYEKSAGRNTITLDGESGHVYASNIPDSLYYVNTTNEIYYSHNGSDDTGNGTAGNPYKTLKGTYHILPLSDIVIVLDTGSWNFEDIYPFVRNIEAVEIKGTMVERDTFIFVKDATYPKSKVYFQGNLDTLSYVRSCFLQFKSNPETYMPITRMISTDDTTMIIPVILIDNFRARFFTPGTNIMFNSSSYTPNDITGVNVLDFTQLNIQAPAAADNNVQFRGFNRLRFYKCSFNDVWFRAYNSERFYVQNCLFYAENISSSHGPIDLNYINGLSFITYSVFVGQTGHQAIDLSDNCYRTQLSGCSFYGFGYTHKQGDNCLLEIKGDNYFNSVGSCFRTQSMYNTHIIGTSGKMLYFDGNITNLFSDSYTATQSYNKKIDLSMMSFTGIDSVASLTDKSYTNISTPYAVININAENDSLVMDKACYANKTISHKGNSCTTIDTIASAATISTGSINNIYITGGISIDSVSTASTTMEGQLLYIIFQTDCILTDGKNLRLAGNFTASTNDSMILQRRGNYFYEFSRSNN